jgi:hypothetical protein
MYKNNILNLVLFLVVISLASIIYFSEEESTELEKVSNSNISGISTIKIKHNQNTTSIIKSANEHWKITEPVAVDANDFRINSILKLLNAPVHNQYSLDEINTSDTGLAEPLTSIQFNNHTIEFGITNPATDLRFIKYYNTVYTIEDVYYPLLSSHFGTLVSLNLLPADSKIEKLVLANQTIAKGEDGLWQSNSKISADNINKTLDHWRNDQAFGVHQYMQRGEELGEVFVYIEGQQQALTYVITDTDPWLILARPEIGLEYHLDIEAYNKLIAPQ